MQVFAILKIKSYCNCDGCLLSAFLRVAAGREAETFMMNFETFPSVFLGHMRIFLVGRAAVCPAAFRS